MEKNSEFIMDITDVTAEGNGVGKVDGIAVFVPGAAVGDKIKVHIVKVKKNFCFGKIVEILEPSKNRIEADCPVFSKCGGCVYRHISYECELLLKQKRVEETMHRIGGTKINAQPILSGTDARYRNKAQYPVEDGGEVGFYAVHSHRIIPVKDCVLQPKEFSDIAFCLKDYMQKFFIPAYDEETGKGMVRHLYVRKATFKNEIMVALVVNGKALVGTDYFISLLKNALGESFKTLVLNVNTEKTNVILGKENILLYGDGYITDVLRENKIRINPLSFYQVNRNMAEILYKKSEEYLQPENKNILDLYCGAGTIGLSFARKAKSIIGVEIIPEAIEDAKFNAKLNEIENARFICADAAKAAEILRDEGTKADAIVLDPPRKGCEAELLKVIAEDFAPERIVYVSCDVATLARDSKILEEKGYTLVEYTPVDLFPRTAHVETVALLIKGENYAK